MTSWLWVLPGALIWLAILALPWRAWGVRERLERDRALRGAPLDDVVVLMPARNEADCLPEVMSALARQGPGLKVVLVDDQSDDDTVAVAESAGLADLVVVRGEPVPEGWTGKVWAQSQARPHLDRAYTLLLDADVLLEPALVAALRAKLEATGAALVSLMVELSMRSSWERLLMPAFVYFFKLLYPFRLANAPGSSVAAAAGGCVLLRTRIIDEIGGFAALRDALIDDCRLARLVKDRRHRIWIGLTRSARSLRSYRGLGEIWNMVARTAYTQLEYSPLWLMLCVLVMVSAFVLPVAAVFAATPAVALAGASIWCAMALSYLPVVRFYGQGPGWALSLPLSGILYLAMTLTSALRYWRGERSRWRGRHYRVGPPGAAPRGPERT